MSFIPGVCFGGFYFSHNGSVFSFDLTGFVSMRADLHKPKIVIRTEEHTYSLNYKTLASRDLDVSALSRLIMAELKAGASYTDIAATSSSPPEELGFYETA
jgi:hypothetical protein